METKIKVLADTDTIRKSYQKVIGDHISALREMAIRRSVNYTLASTDMDYFKLFDSISR